MLSEKEIVELCKTIGLSDEIRDRLLGKDAPDDSDCFVLLTTHGNIDAELTEKVMGLSKQEKLLLYNALRLLERPDANFTMEADWPMSYGGVFDGLRRERRGPVDISFNIASRLGNKPPDEAVEDCPEQEDDCCDSVDRCYNHWCSWREGEHR